MRAVAQALHVVPAPARVHRTPKLVLHPARHFWPTPQPLVIRTLLLLTRQQGLGSRQRETMVVDPLRPLAVVAPHDGPNPARGVAHPFSHLPWRVALLHQSQNMPMGTLYRLAGFTITLVKLFCCQLGFHFDSFGHASVIHYPNGFDITLLQQQAVLERFCSFYSYHHFFADHFRRK